MIYINIIIIVFFAMLALLSRKHFSKYKISGDKRGNFLAVWLSMGESVWLLLANVLPLDGVIKKTNENLRKTQIVPPKKLAFLTREYNAKIVALALGILFTFNLVELGSALCCKIFLKDGENIVEREEYGGDVKKEEIYFVVSGQEETYVLNVSPVKLSYEEFMEKAENLAKEIGDEYFKENVLISDDMNLPLSDKDGVFSISWMSENPEIINSRGRIKEALTEVPQSVGFKMTVEYYDYSAEFKYEALVGLEAKSEETIMVESLRQALNNLEQNTLEEEAFVIPDDINGTKISIKNKKYNSGKFLLLGIIISIIFIVLKNERLKETISKRNEELIREYPYFVDCLWLYIETGMNIKRAIKEYADNKNQEKGVLVGELQYTLNQINTGVAEYAAYEELGNRLDIPLYRSLMRHISQNLQLGTKDLRSLMETEVVMALEARKEMAKKKGETASTKLIFPMILLLLVVMVIVMTPAFMEF